MKNLFLLVSCLVLNAATIDLSYASNSGDTEQRLKAKLLSKDKVRVIVTFNKSAQDVQGVSVASDVSRLKRDLREVKRQHAKNIKLSKHLRVAREFKHLPNIVYDVDAQGLQDLLDDPTISVRENRIARPTLAQSVKRVYPTQKYSPYHGNNDWAVVVLDTGVNKNHPMLAGKVISEACYSTTTPITGDPDIDPDPDQRTYSLCPGGVQSSTASNSGLDCATSIGGCGHGTQMAGIAVGNTTNHIGVAKDGKIIAIKVFSRRDNASFDCPDDNPPCLVAYEDDIMSGLDRVFALRNTYKIAAVNLSLNFEVARVSGNCDLDPLKPAIDMLRSAGIPTVVPTGNDGPPLGFLGNPACISTTFSVGATHDNSDNLWVDTNGNELMDLFAPGVNITTSFGASGYKNVTGTSASAAHVSGAWVATRHAAESAWPTATIGQLESRIRSKGPIVYTPEPTKAKRRLDLTGILRSIDPSSQINPVGFIPAVNYILLGD